MDETNTEEQLPHDDQHLHQLLLRISNFPVSTLKFFHVYQGGRNGNQLEPFEKAMRTLNASSPFDIRVIYSNVMVRYIYYAKREF